MSGAHCNYFTFIMIYIFSWLATFFKVSCNIFPLPPLLDPSHLSNFFHILHIYSEMLASLSNQLVIHSHLDTYKLFCVLSSNTEIKTGIFMYA